MKRNKDKSSLPDSSDLNHEAYKDGCDFYNKDNFTKAKKAFKTALEYWPFDPQAWFALGNCYDELNKYSKAEYCYRESLKYTESENKSDIFYNLANSLYDQNKLAEAIEFYGKVSGQSKVYSSAKINLSRANNELSNKNT